MQGPEFVKRRMSIEKDNNIESLRNHALTLLRDLNASIRCVGDRSPSNYRVVAWNGLWNEWCELAEGNRDYCFGYCDAADHYSEYGGDRLVVCGSFVCYPEELYGANLEDGPNFKDE